MVDTPESRSLSRELATVRARVKELEERLGAVDPGGMALCTRLHELVLQSAEEIIVLLDRNYIIRAVNRSFEHAFGIGQEGVVGREVYGVIALATLHAKAKDLLDRCLDGEVVRFGGWFEFPALGRRFVDVSCTPLRDTSGVVLGVQAVARDDTVRARLELEADFERDWLNNVLGFLRTGLSLINPDMSIAWANTLLHQLFPGKEPVGEICHEFFEGCSTPCKECVIRNAFHTGRPHGGEYRHPESGSWFAVFAQPLLDGSGHVRQVLASFTETTELRRTKKELENSRERFLLALEANRAGVWEADLTTGDIHFSSEWCELMGLSLDVVPGGIEGWKSLVHPLDLPEVIAKYKQYVEAPGEDSLRLDYRLRKGGDQWIWVRVLARLVARDNKGRPKKLVGISLDVTSEHETDELLKRTEQTYLEIFNTTTDAIILHDAETLDIVDANRTFLELFGYVREELPGLNVADISQGHYPFDLVGALEVIRNLYNSESQFFEWLSRKRNGSVFWSEVRIKKVTIGCKTRILASLRDISHHLRIREVLEEREQTLHGILEAAPLLICLVTGESVVWSNSQIQTILGYTSEEVEGADLAVFFSDRNTFPQVREQIQEQLRSQGMARLEADLRHKDGHGVPVVMRLAPLDEKDPTREAICIVADVSHRKQWEQVLLEREARYRDLFDNAPVGILRLTYDGKVLQLNQALAGMLGYDSPAQFLEESDQDIGKVYVEMSRREELKQMLLTHGSVRDFETEWRDRKGRVRSMLLNVRSIREGNALFIDGFVTDLTEKKRIEQEARERDKQLIQADKLISLGILTSGVAHEINNPNNFISLNAPLLKKAFDGLLPTLDFLADREGDFMVGGLPYSRMREHLPRLLDGILSGSRRISDIVENMRRLSRPDLEGPIEIVNLNLMLHVALPFIKPRLVKLRCSLELELAESLPTVRGSSQQIQQVILNLLLNALDAMAQSGGRLLVRTGVTEAGDHVQLSVTDEGPGIPPNVQGQLFTPFFTTKRGSGGTGLGLAISEKIMQIHGGSIELRNNAPPPGATAVMTLPIATGSNEVAP